MDFTELKEENRQIEELLEKRRLKEAENGKRSKSEDNRRKIGVAEAIETITGELSTEDGSLDDFLEYVQFAAELRGGKRKDNDEMRWKMIGRKTEEIIGYELVGVLLTRYNFWLNSQAKYITNALG